MTQILCRIDSENKPVVFLADSVDNGSGTIKAWHDGDKIKKTRLDYYVTTKPLSDTDSKVLADRFKVSVKSNEPVYIRQRLPRVYKTLPNILKNENDALEVKSSEESEIKIETKADDTETKQDVPQKQGISQDQLNDILAKISDIVKPYLQQ
jgi:hypothetical protein